MTDKVNIAEVIERLEKVEARVGRELVIQR